MFDVFVATEDDGSQWVMFEDYQALRDSRVSKDAVHRILGRANKRLHLTALVAGLTGSFVGFVLGVVFIIYLYGGR